MDVGSCRKQQLATLSMQYAQMNLLMKFIMMTLNYF